MQCSYSLTVFSGVSDAWWRFWALAETVDGLHFDLKGRKGLCVIDHTVVVGNNLMVPGALQRSPPEHFVLKVRPIIIPFVHFLKDRVIIYNRKVLAYSIYVYLLIYKQLLNFGIIVNWFSALFIFID